MVAIIASTVLTMVKETYPPLLAYMKSIGHHWMVHGVVIITLFLVLGFLLSRRSWSIGGMTLAALVFITTIISGFALFFLFLTLSL